MEETQTCLSCGIAKELVTINESGVCNTCAYISDKRFSINLMETLEVPLFSRLSGVYLLEFINPNTGSIVGTKLGKARNIEKRVDSYIHPWCFRFGKTYAINLPEELVGEIENLLMKSVNRRKSDSEFVAGDSFPLILKNLETIIHIYRHRLIEWTLNGNY
jgi:hypothetical protein